jgi:hypothetical protein
MDDIINTHKKTKQSLNNKTSRKYPKREALKTENEFIFKIYSASINYENDYKVGYHSPNESTSISNINSLKSFANKIFNKQTDQNELNYQELADLINSHVVVNLNLNESFDKPVGRGNNVPNNPMGGSGSPQYRIYTQPGTRKNGTINKRNIYNYYPKIIEDHPTNNNVIVIFPPVNKNNYQYKMQMKKCTPFSNPCKCCFQSEGRMFLLKGLGNKSFCKNKGMKKRRFDVSDYSVS